MKNWFWVETVTFQPIFLRNLFYINIIILLVMYFSVSYNVVWINNAENKPHNVVNYNYLHKESTNHWTVWIG